MAHKVRYYTDYDLTETREFADWDQALDAAQAHWKETGDVFAARLGPDYTLFADLADYLAALRADADWLAANPQPGCWIGALTDDLDHWVEMGVTTPAELAWHLSIETYADLYKDRHGVRSREDLSSLTLEELDVKIDRLAKMDSADW